MNLLKNFVAFSVLVLSLFAANFAQAAPLYSTTATPTRNDYTNYVGLGFTPSSALQVTSLGYIDDDGDGNSISHIVELWEQTGVGVGTLVTSATVLSGTASPLTSGFRYASISPVNLTAGTKYVLVAQVVNGSGDAWANLYSGGFTFNLPVGSIDARVGGGGSFPAAIVDVNEFYQAPNLIANAVPEPTGLTLGLFGIVGLWRIVRKRS